MIEGGQPGGSHEGNERPATPDAAALLALKDTMVEAWKQLPPAHQASMTLVLLHWVLDGEYGDWARGALGLLYAGETTPEPPDFTIGAGSEQAASFIADPETLAAIRKQVLHVWGKLPLVDQAALVVEQLKGLLSTEWGGAVRDLLAEQPEHEANALDEIFPISGVARADLKSLEFSDEEIARLTDLDMVKIAGRMSDHYISMGFWDDLEYVARHILAQKGKP